jgi:trans-2,3-dihydro-3-hydroxyanthranilate isomerase
MALRTFYILDVFTDQKYSGNQLAVFRDAAAIPPEEMQQIAREINFSETTFILSDKPREGGYDVRIFTPKEEVPFAGHPTLGTAFLIRDALLKGKAKKVTLNLKVGQIPVTFYSDESGEMKQKEPTFGEKHDRGILAEVLGLDIAEIDARYPIQEVSTGLPFFIVPLSSLNALKKAKVNLEKYYRLIAQTESKGILVYTPEGHNPGDDLSVRVFVDYFGVPEDPATGSANGCLAGYLAEHCVLGSGEVDVIVGQGHEIGRPSRLRLRAKRLVGGIEVFVGGQAVIVARGGFFR